jgi:hypothetical protein
MAYRDSSSLQGCLAWYSAGRWARCIWMWGPSMSTLWFFWEKQGVFEERGTSQTNGETEQEQELNEMIINREFERINSTPH